LAAIERLGDLGLGGMERFRLRKATGGDVLRSLPFHQQGERRAGIAAAARRGALISDNGIPERSLAVSALCILHFGKAGALRHVTDEAKRREPEEVVRLADPTRAPKASRPRSAPAPGRGPPTTTASPACRSGHGGR
jgi:hypothetical protein